MRKIILLAALSTAMTVPAFAAGKTLYYQYAFPGLKPVNERIILMESEAACEDLKAKLLGGPFAAMITDAGGTFTAGCR